VISNSPTELQAVPDAILRSATQLLGARSTSVFCRLGEEIHLAAFASTGPMGGLIGGQEAARRGLDVHVHDSGAQRRLNSNR
jgi:hypothetical protein